MPVVGPVFTDGQMMLTHLCAYRTAPSTARRGTVSGISLCPSP